MRAAIVRWVLAVVFPSTAKLPGLDTLDVSEGLAEVFAGPPLLRLGLYGAIFAFLISPVLTIGWPLPAPLLSRHRRDQHANAMSNSRWYLLRQSMMMLKTIGGLLWGAHPSVRAKLGFPAYTADPGSFRTSDGTSTARRGGA